MTSQLSGSIGSVVVKDDAGNVIKRYGLEVACAPGGKYGVILVSTEEELAALEETRGYQKGKIVPIKDSDTLERSQIMALPSLNPQRVKFYRGSALLKYFTGEELDEIAKLTDKQLLAMKKAVIELIKKISKTKPDNDDKDNTGKINEVQDTDGIPASVIEESMKKLYTDGGYEGDIMTLPFDDFESLKQAAIETIKAAAGSSKAENKPESTSAYRELLKAELKKLKIVFANNAKTQVLEELLMEEDPDNAVLPKKSKEQLEKELLDGQKGRIDPPASDKTEAKE